MMMIMMMMMTMTMMMNGIVTVTNSKHTVKTRV